MFGAVTGAFPLGSKYAANLILDAERDEVLVVPPWHGKLSALRKKIGIGGGCH